MSDRYTMVRYTHQGEKFEILVDPDKGLAYKNGERDDLTNVLMVDTIFTDANKGSKPTEAKLKDVFGTEDPIEIAEIMFEKGVFQLTAQQRKSMTEQTLRKIIALISRNYVDPATKLPHPPLRIENALEEIKVNIDPFKDAEEQLKRDEWTGDGSWVAVVAISAAMRGELIDRLGKATQGNLQTKIMK